MTSDTSVFLNALFASKPELAKCYIWGKRGPQPKSPMKSLWCDDVAGMLRAVQTLERDEGWDIYAGIATSPRKWGADKRVGKDHVYSLPALFGDIDYGELGHKKPKGNNPATEAEAIAIVDAMGLPPSLIVNSGGGIHAYWIFQSHWVFAENVAERERARLASTGLQRWLQDIAVKREQAVDSTFDLARVLRVPGTANHKTDEKRIARIVRDSGIRYTPEEIEKLIPAESKAAAVVKVATQKAASVPATPGATMGFVLSSTAVPPGDKVVALQAAEPRFDAAMKYQRRDLKDQSPSGYDLAMANFCAIYGWTDQEIVNLLINVRHNQRQDLKLDRADYYQRTLNLCRRHVMQDSAVKALTAQTAAARIEAATSDKPSAPSTPSDRENSLEFVSRAIGIRVKRVLKYMQDPPKYRIETNNGGIDLGTVENLIGQVAIRNAIATVDGALLPKFKNEDWEAIAQSLLSACECVNTGPESTDKGAISEWLNVYLDENHPATVATETSLANQNPHYEGNEYVCFFLTHFKNWLYQRQGEKMSGKQLGILLRYVDGEPSQVAIEVESDGVKKRTTRAIWRLPRRRKA